MLYGTLIYLEFDGKLLMVQKKIREGDPNSGYCAAPGGKPDTKEEKSAFFEKNLEGITKCAVREFEEETGLKISDLEFRGTILFDNSERKFDNWKNPKDFFVYVFTTNDYEGELITETHEGYPKWFPKDEILGLPQNPGDKKIYEWLNDGRVFEGVIKHKGKILDEEGTFVNYLD